MSAIKAYASRLKISPLKLARVVDHKNVNYYNIAILCLAKVMMILLPLGILMPSVYGRAVVTISSCPTGIHW